MRPIELQPINKVLDRLDKVKAKNTNQWQAACPAHDDRSPSLTITEIEDGTVLVKCWAGCNANEIVTSIGLSLKDLFPRTETTNKPSRPRPSKQAIEHERLIVSIAEGNFSKGVTLSNEDNERYRLAVKRLKEVD